MVTADANRLDAAGFMDAMNTAPGSALASPKPVIESPALPTQPSPNTEPLQEREQPAPEPPFVPYSQRKFGDIVEKDNYWKGLKSKYGPLVKGREHYLDLIDKPLIPVKSDSRIFNFEIKPGETWNKNIFQNEDIENKPLFYASLLNEGAERLHSEKDSPKSNFGGINGGHYFGLDTIGTRMNEFISKGYLPSNFPDRITVRKMYNEKGEQTNSATFQNIQDAIIAKNAFWKSGKENSLNVAKEIGVTLSQPAENFFTLVSYNYGEGGARRMMQDYKEKGLLKGDKFLEKSFIPDYNQVWKNAKQRMDVARMVESEEFGK
jgi:hypothetical protein